jgi:hypothetical protein
MAGEYSQMKEPRTDARLFIFYHSEAAFRHGRASQDDLCG